MAGVDLETYRFDYDLTFAALLMNADGRIYHTFGGRDATDPQSHLSVPAFVRVLERARATHERESGKPAAPRRHRPQTIEQIPPMAERIRRGKAPECFHCHMVHDARREDAQARKKWRRDDLWIYPDPVEVGLRLHRDDQTRVTEVLAGSPAAAAGIAVGDTLERLGGQDTLTFGDVQRALHEAPERGTLEVAWRRGAESSSVRLRLPADWKEADPRVFAWRPSKWSLSPKPGFGGKRLDAAELSRAGLAPGVFAFRVNYLVTWGDEAETGRSAQKAGLRKGDVVTSVAGKGDFESEEHFQAWFRLTQEPGSRVPVEVLRDGRKHVIDLPVLP